MLNKLKRLAGSGHCKFLRHLRYNRVLIPVLKHSNISNQCVRCSAKLFSKRFMPLLARVPSRVGPAYNSKLMKDTDKQILLPRRFRCFLNQPEVGRGIYGVYFKPYFVCYLRHGRTSPLLSVLRRSPFALGGLFLLYHSLGVGSRCPR
jgi:hypothetical protein